MYNKDMKKQINRPKTNKEFYAKLETIPHNIYTKMGVLNHLGFDRYSYANLKHDKHTSKKLKARNEKGVKEIQLVFDNLQNKLILGGLFKDSNINPNFAKFYLNVAFKMSENVITTNIAVENLEDYTQDDNF